MNNLQIYKANSANDGAYKELWIRGAGLFIPQVNVLLSKAVKHTVIMNTCDSFPVDSFTTLLGEHFNKYGSDKATSHHYYKVYGSILQDLGINNQLNLLEIGMGTNNPSLLSSMGKNGKPGASLRAFRDALPKSNIFGADVDEAILFTEDRITTVQVDQMDQDSFQKISAINSMFDLIIDDGLHSIAGNLNTMIWAMDHIKTGGYIVIEDIAYETNWNVIDYIMSNSHGWTNKMVSCSGLLYILQKIG
jgi:hypothetical protein